VRRAIFFSLDEVVIFQEKSRHIGMRPATARVRLLFLACATLAVISCFYCDAHRLSLFHANKSEYETLLSMLQRDERLTFINDGLTEPEDPSTTGISPKRIAEYRRHMSNIGCGAIRYEPFIGSAVFVSNWGRNTDILYFPIRSAEDAKSDGIPLTPAQAHHIEGGWYLTSENF
jgi:hypothetical protein